MILNWKCGALADGLRFYRNREFFLAHEHWEGVWLRLEEPEKSFLQALIQTAAAFHHFHRGNSIGAASLLRRALRRLQLCPSCFGGISVTLLSVEIYEWVEALESDGRFVPVVFPQICPFDEPQD